ncbi:PREDICTED: uncharacterized protein LOC108973652 [Bactrocera latifrons]|uniref:uncharacterized protein LOC108973652 n=1 Tax=Bactrocera latifrons TaxID=174628 RepID=UPI0008DC8A9D|nr:PREDICTED: uncharacterized protein LOC108973652 [Bactrocera latifrons]
MFAKLLRAHEYYKSIQPLFFFTHALGITSLSLFAYCCAYIVYCKDTYIGHFLNTDITNGGEIAIVLASGIAAVIVLITNTLRRRRLLWVFEYFPKIDKNFERIGICWNYTKVLQNVIWQLIFTGFIFLMTLIIYIGCWVRLQALPSWQLIYITLNQLIGISFTILIFNFLMMLTKLRLTALNKPHTYAHKQQ